ncbi:ATP-binding protein [Bdellovibrio bacteriovorus]|uniref:ATP-binding protein n=1 Tax=Bdellovibrio bacteriovorus TaxID=959 RepID=UPI0035A5FCEC
MSHLNFNAHFLMMLYLLGVMVCLFFAGASFEYRKQASVRLYMAIMGMYAGWLIMNLLMVFSPTLETKETFARLRFIFISQLPALWVYFGYELFRRPQDSLPGRWIYLFSVVPTMVGVACVVPGLHGYVIHQIEPYLALGIPAIRWRLGALGLIHITYSYVLLLYFVFLCWMGVRKTSGHKKNYSWLLVIGLGSFALSDLVGIFMIAQVRFLGIPVLTQIFSAVLFFYILHKQQVLHSFSQRSHRFFEALPTSVLLLDSTHRLVQFNTRAGDSFGLGMSSVGLSVDQVLPRSLYEDLPAFLETPTQSLAELLGQGRFGEERSRYFEISCEPLDHPILNGLGHVMVFNDVTELKRTTQVNQRLMSLISHDLLGNLSSISLLAEYREGQNDAVIAEAARSSVDLVKNILLWSASKGDFYECNKEPVRIGDLVRTVVDQARASLNSRNLEVRGSALREETSAIVDIKMLQAVIRNLLSNAIKYSPRGADIELSLEIRDDWARLTVRDRGPGFDPAKMKQLLQQSGRRPSGDMASAEGYGIGLFLANQFLRQHGGHLEFEQEKSWGGKATAVFPLRGE